MAERVNCSSALGISLLVYVSFTCYPYSLASANAMQHVNEARCLATQQYAVPRHAMLRGYLDRSQAKPSQCNLANMQMQRLKNVPGHSQSSTLDPIQPHPSPVVVQGPQILGGDIPMPITVIAPGYTL